ncbi:hypothetical protein WJX81_006207 [Elliptochloris bilobata]|uniref:SGNH hydrolase-type esterase domain-containing protein n=1 Tax=Elliptochloris bilobata TaxID=381761 RepID=A0AAW1R1C2_9CHLO
MEMGCTRTQRGASGAHISSVRGTSLVVRKALRLTHLEKYPPLPYFQGRWSNGRVYTEYLAGMLGLRLVDNAVGGATTGAHNNSVLNVIGSFPDARRCQPPGMPPACPVQVVAVPSLLTQVAEYVKQEDQNINHLDIMLLEIGPNDVFGGLFGPAKIKDGDYDGFADRMAGAIWKALMTLHGAGARRFLVFNVPPISRTPLISRLAGANAALPNRTAVLVDAINGRLRPRVDQFRQLTGAAVVFYANSLLDAQTQPAAPALGFTNLRDACSTFPVDVYGSPAFAVPPVGVEAASVCHNPGEHIFWDHVHFTTRFHWLQAGVVAAEMAPLLASFPP